jgi:hypothetical protein
MKAALYLLVSKIDQSVEHQRRELHAVADRMGHDVVEIYSDNGICPLPCPRSQHLPSVVQKNDTL